MKFSKVRDVKSPVRGTDKAAGIDFFVPEGFSAIVQPLSDCLIPSGICTDIPEGFMLMGADKSGVVTSRKACLVCGREPKEDAFDSRLIIGAKIIDEDYQGEIHIHVINIGLRPVVLQPGMKIAQFILVPVSYEGLEEVPKDELFKTETARGSGAFGSTGTYK